MKIEKYDEPFEHYIIDDFLEPHIAKKLSEEFPSYESDKWFVYDNPLEHKKTINSWYEFPPETYYFLHFMQSANFIESLQELTGVEKLYPDMGLHGGGWHIHGNKGKLNVHQDYAIHPKLNLLRKYNLIIYLSEDWNNDWGGNLEFWSHNADTNLPKEKVKTVENKFNRAVLFDASQNSWHGFNDRIVCPEDKYRKSIAIYYLSDVPENTPDRKRAMYSPDEQQKNDPEIMKLIRDRMKI